MSELEKQFNDVHDHLYKLHNVLWTIVYVQNDYYGKGLTCCFDSSKARQKTFNLDKSLRKYVEIPRSFL